MTLSALASFDDLRRCMQVLTDGTAEEEFLRFLRMVEEYQQKCMGYAAETARIQQELDDSFVRIGDLESKLFHARRIIEMESKLRRQAEHERDSMETKIVAVADLLRHERNLNNETRDKLAFLHTMQSRKRKSLNTLREEKSHLDINSTGSLLSDLSITQSEDDFLDVRHSKSWREHRPSLPKNTVPCVGSKRSRRSGGLNISGAIVTPTSNSTTTPRMANGIGVDQHTLDVAQGPERFCATTKVTIPQDGQGVIRAESTIESLPVMVAQNGDGSTSTPRRSALKETAVLPMTPINAMAGHVLAESGSPAQLRPLMRKHTFNQKTFLRSDNCVQCQRRIRFGAVGLRCRDCPVRCHIDCRQLLTVSCVPQCGTPTAKSMMGYISDFASSISPMIPALIVHCVNEIEARGLSEVGLYRVSSSEREYKALKEQFLRGKSTPHLANTDIYVLCCCVKDFLRSLREPLIPTSQWKDFANAVQNPDAKQAEKMLYKAVKQLPQSNRDTLAFLILHFQRIAQCPEVRMPIENTSLIFGPTIVGYSSLDPDQHAIYTEVFTQKQVMIALLQLPSSFWQEFVQLEATLLPPSATPVKRVPSSSKDFFSLYATPHKRKFYATPPPSAQKK